MGSDVYAHFGALAHRDGCPGVHLSRRPAVTRPTPGGGPRASRGPDASPREPPRTREGAAWTTTTARLTTSTTTTTSPMARCRRTSTRPSPTASCLRRSSTAARSCAGPGWPGPAWPPPPRSAARWAAPRPRAPARAGTTARAAAGYLWLAGDHHIHTQYSSDAQYRVVDQVQHASAYGLDWMVITDHGSVAHAKIGVDKVNPDIVAARERVRRGHPGLPGPGVEHPGRRARHGLRPPGSQRGRRAQGVRERLRRGRERHHRAATPANEALALAGHRLPRPPSVTQGRVQDAMFFANHPARKGLDSPHEIRGWRDAAPADRASAWRARPGTRPPASRRRSVRARAAASTTTPRPPTASPATRSRATAPGAASTG